MRAGIPDDEWDRVWAEYDRHAVAPTPAPAPSPRPPVRRRGILGLVAVAAGMVTFSAGTHSVSRDQLPQRSARQILISNSPVEAELPPVELAIGRLANESALAACWVLALRPDSGDCQGTDGRR